MKMHDVEINGRVRRLSERAMEILGVTKTVEIPYEVINRPKEFEVIRKKPTEKKNVVTKTRKNATLRTKK